MAVDLYQSTAVSTKLNEEMKRELIGINLSKRKVNAAIRYFGTLPKSSQDVEVKIILVKVSV